MAKKVLKKLTKKVIKKSADVAMPVRSAEDILYELEKLRSRKKDMDKREKILKADLGIILEGEGVKDSKGTFKLLVGNILAQKQARKSVKLNPEKSEKFFKSIGIWEEVIETKEILNESYVEQALTNEKFTMEELEAITDVKTTYAILFAEYKPEDDMPEIEVE